MSEQQNRYQVLMSQGHSSAWDLAWERAASFYEQALDEIANDPKALLNLALAWFKLEDYQKSLEYYLQAAKVKPNDPVPLEKIATLYRKLGQRGNASKFSLRAAENYLKEKSVDKAIENWGFAIANNPENLQAHARLAAIYERLGRKSQAAREYLQVASLMQHSGEKEKAIQAIERALTILPGSTEAQKSINMLQAGLLLPKPERPRGGTDTLSASEIKAAPEREPQKEAVASEFNAIDRAYSAALSDLAKLFFEKSSIDDAELDTASDPQLIEDGSPGSAFTKNADKKLIMSHLGQAVELQTLGENAQAAEALKSAITAGLDAPSAHYSLGLLWVRSKRLESAVRSLQHVLSDPEYALGAYLLLGDIYYQREEYNKAAIKYLEALRTADAMIVQPEHMVALSELYDPLIENQSRQNDDHENQQLSDKISNILTRPDWQQFLINTRRELGQADKDSTPLPLAEILFETGISDIAVAMNTVRRLAREGHFGAAIDHILHSLEQAPTYLPLHIVLGEVLISKACIPEAVQKFKVISHAYSARGEAHRAVDILKRIIELTPMDLDVRRELIDQFVINGNLEDAIDEIIRLAEIHYSLAELSEARKAYADAINLAPQTNDPTYWTVRILHFIANIDRQSLDWQKARDHYDRICSLVPQDVDAVSNVIDLSFKLKDQDRALESLDQFVKFANTNQQENDALAFLERLAEEQVDQPMVLQRLAKQYERMEMIDKAIDQLDKAGDLLLDAGDKTSARIIIQHIIKLAPNKQAYQELLETL
ncbi:MAG: tetratricopeptide repeat protein [Anaerolineae bacterium]|nr:tetratricopeptide repeat protein [Anaerolineae bacterium]